MTALPQHALAMQNKISGPFPNLFRYEYFNESRCAPGATTDGHQLPERPLYDDDVSAHPPRINKEKFHG